MAGLNWINHMHHDLRFIELLVRRKWDKLDKCNTNYRHRLAHVFINRNRDPQTVSQSIEVFQAITSDTRRPRLDLEFREHNLPKIIFSDYNYSFDCNFMREQTVLETHIWLAYNNSFFATI